MVSSAAPERARWPKWRRCQSVMRPSWAEYWHMGAITMRLASSRSPIRRGENSLARVMGGLRGAGPIGAVRPISPHKRLVGPKGLGAMNWRALSLRRELTLRRVYSRVCLPAVALAHDPAAFARMPEGLYLILREYAHGDGSDCPWWERS